MSDKASVQTTSAADAVPHSLRVSAEWTWRLLVLLAGFIALCFMIIQLRTVVVPFAIALLGAAMLAPLVDWMNRYGVPRGIAVMVSMIGMIGAVAGVLSFVVEQTVNKFPELAAQFNAGIAGITDWLKHSHLPFSEEIRLSSENVKNFITEHSQSLTANAIATATVLTEALTGLLLATFILIFLLYDGPRIWEFVTRIVPSASRRRVRLAGIAGFRSLTGFVRATVAVAAVDAIGIGVGLGVLGVPLAIPLASLVFIGAFIPLVGAFVTGFVAVFIALVTKGIVTAAIVFGIIVVVMQVEGHILQPMLLGRAVAIHPLAVVLSITTGIVLAGISGGLLAVPIVAILNSAIRSLVSDDPVEFVEALPGPAKDTPIPVSEVPVAPAEPKSASEADK
ncbi:AI-2E family transporter [Smaragdicoccus niigatensis]|uniref:AI-2E family transporter n=1 Tax=Smaragdicoccus niigatensis TaxID=359359 RepID=UPI0009DBDAB2|nr:AI-2E family transporter [Smaragdicoccus niigatensis]